MARCFTVNGFTHCFVHFSFQKEMVSRTSEVGNTSIISQNVCPALVHQNCAVVFWAAMYWAGTV